MAAATLQAAEQLDVKRETSASFPTGIFCLL
jgi:hypothetical protein